MVVSRKQTQQHLEGRDFFKWKTVPTYGFMLRIKTHYGAIVRLCPVCILYSFDHSNFNQSESSEPNSQNSGNAHFSFSQKPPSCWLHQTAGSIAPSSRVPFLPFPPTLPTHLLLRKCCVLQPIFRMQHAKCMMHSNFGAWRHLLNQPPCGWKGVGPGFFYGSERKTVICQRLAMDITV